MFKSVSLGPAPLIMLAICFDFAESTAALEHTFLRQSLESIINETFEAYSDQLSALVKPEAAVVNSTAGGHVNF